MPRELLRTLAEDLARLTVAGSTVAPGDERLGKRAEALHGLAAKVPAIKVLANAVDRLHTSAPAGSAPALLDLLVLLRQARASLATAGVEGDLGPLPDLGAWFNTTPTRTVYHVVDQSNGADSGTRVLRETMDHSLLNDLRLADPLVRLTERSVWPAELDDNMLGRLVLPQFGRGLLPALWARMARNGRCFLAAYLIDPEATTREALDRRRHPEKGFFWLLTHAGPPALAALAETLKRPKVHYSLNDIEQAAAETWQRFDQAPLPLLREALGSEVAAVRELAARRLSELGPNAREALPELLAALQVPERPHRYHLIRPIGLIGPEAADAVPVLLELLKDNETPVRVAAAVALGRVGVPRDRVVDALREAAVEDAEEAVRLTAGKALEQLGAPKPRAPKSR